jgi:hypothetical protein
MSFFRNSEFLNQNIDFLIFQQRNSKKKSDQNFWNQKLNQNSAFDGGPRNRNQKLEFPTKLLLVVEIGYEEGACIIGRNVDSAHGRPLLAVATGNRM